MRALVFSRLGQRLKFLALYCSSFLTTVFIIETGRSSGQPRGIPMQDSVLLHFRSIAESMQSEPADWQWIGPHLSQRMFGITEARARAYAERHGGTASKM